MNGYRNSSQKKKMGTIVTKNKKDSFHKGYGVFNWALKDEKHKRIDLEREGESQQRKDRSKGKKVNTVGLC